MKTYRDLKAQIVKLEQKAEALRKTELRNVIAQVRKTIVDYALTPVDLGLVAPGNRARAGKATKHRSPLAGASAAPKYRDPTSGQTWTGRGRPPAWIALAKDRNALLIDASADALKVRSTKRKAAKPSSATKHKNAAPTRKVRTAKRKTLGATKASTAARVARASNP